MKSFSNNVYVLYVVFLCAFINIAYFVYRNDFKSIFIFIVSCLVLYMITKNMIFILGFSIVFINSLAFVKKEGFKDKNKSDESETNQMDDSDNDLDDSDDEKNDYMQDKDVLKKIKKMNPKMLNSLNKLNSIDMKELNEYINTLKDFIDP